MRSGHDVNDLGQLVKREAKTGNDWEHSAHVQPALTSATWTDGEPETEVLRDANLKGTAAVHSPTAK